jgi:hypothetical protein
MPDVAGILCDAYFAASDATEIVDGRGRGVAVYWVNELDSRCAIDIPASSKRCDAEYVAVASLRYGPQSRAKRKAVAFLVACLNSPHNACNAVSTLASE